MASVAILGRPNVGKSSLFNRLLGRRDAIVADEAGVTRDVKAAPLELEDGRRIDLLDTGGLWSGDAWERAIRTRVEVALQGVDLVLFCVDGAAGLAPADHEIADLLRRRGTNVLLVATKVDDATFEERPAWFELLALGFGEPVPTSAMHARGIADLRDRLTDAVEAVDDDADEEAVTVAITGRPNAGKSSLTNAILGDERVIVSEEAGTTRDAIDVRLEVGGRPFVLVDTAGLRRKPDRDVAFYARVRSEAALRRADVAILVVDPFEVGDHEMRIAGLALETGTPVVVAINKWDLVEDEDLQAFRTQLAIDLAHLTFAPWVYVSAKTDFGLHELLASVVRVYDQARRRVATGTLNGWLEVWTQRQTPPNHKGRSLKLLYATQADVAPPTFVLSVNDERLLTRAYEHYLRNRIQEDLGFGEVPVRLVFKARSGTGKRVRT